MGLTVNLAGSFKIQISQTFLQLNADLLLGGHVQAEELCHRGQEGCQPG
jgi:hypothetical protein